MIANCFDYYRPASLKEAYETFQKVPNAVYYGGGSEIITMARAGSIQPAAVIDLKGISDLHEMTLHKTRLLLGGALTLTQIAESGLFPLLGTTVSRIADHTNQVRITLGGNLCSTILYKEAMLPLLLCDADVVVQGETARTTPLAGLSLSPGEFIVRAEVPAKYLKAPYVHAKKTKLEKIDYPLVTLAGIKTEDGIRLAFAGIGEFPIRDPGVETVANNGQSPAQRADGIVQVLQDRVQADSLASREYRAFVLRQTVENALKRLDTM